MTAEDYKEGQVLLINKPLYQTSFQVVNKIRWHIKQRFNIRKIKVGHAGTLDPLVTGLLIICTGKQTKNISKYQSEVKEYIGTITLGGTTPSFDLETEVDQKYPIDHIHSDFIYETAQKFIGRIQQKPPIFSAVKKDGKRLYELAREGKTVDIEPRKVTISEFEITTIELPKIQFRVVCSKGTYIRSLANDFGKALQSGGHLSELQRTKIGDFSVTSAISLDGFIKNLNEFKA
ncbi:MAG: tRNA pseudouridine(55) synthase TruB [Flavobacteriaceae bacterium]|nr:MAG: tRNA pseudouridine(55) synthase TruB [Flavobacteriaceae bacterium]